MKTPIPIKDAVVLIGHGSLRSDSGASMIRLAARLRQQGHAPIAEACFLNYSRPTLAEAVEKCVGLGATRLTIQPYFLIDGVYVREDLPGDIQPVARQHPGLPIHLADCFGFHEKLAALALDRVQSVPGANRPADDCALLLMAHGTPLEAANEPVYRLTDWLQKAADFSAAQAAFLDCNDPRIGPAIDGLVAGGAGAIVAFPYFLHRGRHLRQDIPELLAAARQRHPGLDLWAAPHIGYDLRLADVIADRLAASVPLPSA